MKPGTIVFIAIAFIAVAAVSYHLGKRQPSADLQSEIAGLKSLAISQEQTIDRMDSTIQSYDLAIKEFVQGFDQFKLDNKSQLERMERHAARGREFQKAQIEKLAELDRRRDALSEEAAKFEY